MAQVRFAKISKDITDADISLLPGVWINGWMLLARLDGGLNVGTLDDELEIYNKSTLSQFETWLREQHARWLEGHAPAALESDKQPDIVATRFIGSPREVTVVTDLSNGVTLRMFYFNPALLTDAASIEVNDCVTFENDQVRDELRAGVFRALEDQFRPGQIRQRKPDQSRALPDSGAAN